MAIIEGIAALKGALDVSKTAIDLLRRPTIDDQQVREKLIELQDLVFSAQQALGEAQDDERKLKARIAELERYADFGKDITLHHGVYWYEGYPYCPICWDVDRKPARLGGPLRIWYRRIFRSGAARFTRFRLPRTGRRKRSANTMNRHFRPRVGFSVGSFPVIRHSILTLGRWDASRLVDN